MVKAHGVAHSALLKTYNDNENGKHTYFLEIVVPCSRHVRNPLKNTIFFSEKYFDSSLKYTKIFVF